MPLQRECNLIHVIHCFEALFLCGGGLVHCIDYLVVRLVVITG